MFNPEIKKLYLKRFENEETRDVYARVFAKSFVEEERLNKDLFSFTDDEWESYFRNILKPKTKESARSYCNVLSNYVQWAMENNYSSQLFNPLKRRQDYFYEFVPEIKTYISFEEKQSIISDLVNKQDSFIIEALWNGIQGLRVCELTNLQLNDFDFPNNTVNLRDVKDNVVRSISLGEDTNLIELAMLANREQEYLKLNGEADYMDKIKDRIELAPSKYVLKGAIIGDKNRKKDQKISHYTVYNRLEMIKSLEKMEEYSDALTTKNIVRSGMIYMAFKLFKRDKELDRAQIEEICQVFNIKYKWALRDFLNLDMLRKLYPSDMKSIENKIAMD